MKIHIQFKFFDCVQYYRKTYRNSWKIKQWEIFIFISLVRRNEFNKRKNGMAEVFDLLLII